MTQDLYLKSETTKRYDIPLTHLEFDYIRSCSNVKELEKILKLLRSGDEGCFPELEKEAEDRLQTLDPKSRVLRKDAPVLTHRDLDKSELDTLKVDLQDWKSNMETAEKALNSSQTKRLDAADDTEAGDGTNEPPVRTGAVILGSKKVKRDAENKTSGKKTMPRSYKEWDKFDTDKELDKLEKEEENRAAKDIGSHKSAGLKPEKVSDIVDTKGMTEEEKKVKAVREKDKGNEAFHSHDYEESILYYSRSISVIPLPATYNNRALAYLRLSRWDEAIEDCSHVLQVEPNNIKALLRRGTALKGQMNIVEAQQDVQKVLEIESNNKTAQNLMKEIEKELQEESKTRKEKGRHLVIEEVDGSEDEDDCAEERLMEWPDQDKESVLVNGVSHSEEDSQQSSVSCGEKEKNNTAPVMTSPQNTGQGKDIWVEDEVEERIGKGVDDQANVKVPSASEDGVGVLLETPMPVRELHEVSAEDQANEQASVHTEMGHSQVLSNAETLEDQKDQKNSTCGLDKGKTEALDGNTEGGVGSEERSVAEQSREVSRNKEEPVLDTDEGVASKNRAEDLSVYEESRECFKNEKQDPVIDVENEDKGAENKNDTSPEERRRRPILIQKMFPSSLTAVKEKGNSMFRAGQFAEAISIYSRIIDKLKEAPGQEVNLSLMHSNRAACHLKTGDCQAAITDATASLHLVAHATKPLLRRASAYEHLEKYRQAYVDYKHVLSLDTTSPVAHLGASRCQKALQDQDGPKWREKLPPLVRVSRWEVPEIVEEASAASTASCNAHPPPLVSLKSQVLISAQQQESQETGRQQTAASDEKLDRQETQAFLLEQPNNERTPADGKTRKILSPEEQFENHKAEGNKHVQKQEYDKAIQCYCKCLELFKDKAVVYTNRALCFLKTEKAQEAQDDCDAALRLEENNPKALYRRALARKMKQHYKESLQDLLKLLQLEPANTAAKHEVELVKALYREEYDKMKKESSQVDNTSGQTTRSEKKRTRIQIEEIDDVSDTEKDGFQSHRPTASASESKPSSHTKTPPHPEPPKTKPQSPASEKQPKHQGTEGSKKTGKRKSKASAVKQTSLGLPVTPTSKKEGKLTPYDFLQHWNSLRQAREVQAYAQLLAQIAPEDLPRVISNNLDGDILEMVICCAAQDAQTGHVERAYKVLCSLRQVPRFSTVVLFLSNKDKQDIQKVLELVSGQGIASPGEMAAVRKDFGIK